jgi:hypothetical protein
VKSRTFKVKMTLPEARTLQRELETIKVKMTQAGNEQFESWRDRDHDDLVLAVAIASWAAEYLPWPPPGATGRAGADDGDMRTLRLRRSGSPR